jgi:hypothetical protein
VSTLLRHILLLWRGFHFAPLARLSISAQKQRRLHDTQHPRLHDTRFDTRLAINSHPCP